MRELSAAIASTQRGFEDVIAGLRTAPTSEREVEGIFNLRARVEGNDVGYGTIAAAGRARLHPPLDEERRRRCSPARCCCSTPGVEGNSLYTADITRTLPISGRFSSEQREIYELVHAAQAAAFERGEAGQRLHRPEPRGDEGARRGPRAAGHPRRRRARRSPTRTSSTSATRSTTSATCSGSTCTTAPRPAPRPTSSASSSRGWCSPSSRASTSRPTTSPCPRGTAASACASRTTSLVTAPGHAEPLRRHPQRGRRRRGVDGEGVEIAGQAHPRLTPDAGGHYRRCP